MRLVYFFFKFYGKLLEIFFKFYGLKRIFHFEPTKVEGAIDIIQIAEELSQFNKDIKVESPKNKCFNITMRLILYLISLSYSFFVLLIIIWPFAYAIALSIIHKKSEYVLLQLFTLVYVAQFITGYIYYNSNGYTKMIKRNHKYINKIIFVHILGFLTSLALAVIMVILIGLEIKADIFNMTIKHFNIVSKVFFFILLFVTLFYSYNIFIANLIIFSSVLIIHCLELRSYDKLFTEFISDYQKEIELPTISKEFNQFKDTNNNSIHDLNNMFSSMTIIGGVSVYFLILLYAFSKYSITHYVDIAIYAIVEIIYFYTIYELKNHVQNIVSLGNSPKFMNRFLYKTKFLAMGGEQIEIGNEMITLELVGENTKIIKEMGMRTMVRTSENANALDWLIFNAILTEKWEYFQLFGFDINDATIIKKILAIAVGYVFISQANTYWDVNLAS